MKSKIRLYNDSAYEGPRSFFIYPSGRVETSRVGPEVFALLSAGLHHKKIVRDAIAARRAAKAALEKGSCVQVPSAPD